MSAYETILPFPRGKTACDGVINPSPDMFLNLAGRIFQVTDTVHGTGQVVLLRCVQLTNNITAARKFMKFSTSSPLDFGRRVSGFNNAQGGPVKPLDDAYPVGATLLANDYVYVVEKGPCFVLTETSSVDLAAGAAVVSDNTGRVDGAAPATGDCIVGRIDAGCNTTNTTVRIHVEAGLTGGEGT